MQFILLSVLIGILLIVLLFILIQFLMNEERKRNFPLGTLDAIYTATNIEGGEAKLHEDVKKQLDEDNFWLQILNKKGDVITSHNAPSQLPNHYNLNELILIEETRQFRGFYIYSQMDSIYNDEPYLFLLGFENNYLDNLEEWFSLYGEEGAIAENKLEQLQKELIAIQGSIQVLDKNGKVEQTIGSKIAQDQYDPLEILMRRQAPGNYENDSVIYHDSHSGKTWIMHIPRAGESLVVSGSILTDIIKIFVIIGLTFLVVTICMSVWHGFRYGKPLLLFTGWLERMGYGKYDEVLTEKERKKIFRKNGNVRLRYRLYKEVINAFYDMAEKLASAEKERKQLEKTREEWMTGISHDLRTPLSTIEGYGHLLESGQYAWTEDELKDMGKMIREKGDYMTDLLEDFNLAFQLKNNSLPHSFVKMDVNELTRRIVLKFVNDITLQEIAFSFLGLDGEINIMVDPRWFERMIDNLIFNAIKHNPRGTEITISLKPKGTFTSIIIKDNGKGMDDQTIERLFDRYYRGTNTEKSSEGVGLGMSIAKAIAELHHGKISVESKLNSGTTIELSFPIIE